ncbi:MAG: hypothetical protein HQ478_10100 [Chloroflexi bacterium]|nr:hypothetical protein [Chloroflexota bacterium]
MQLIRVQFKPLVMLVGAIGVFALTACTSEAAPLVNTPEPAAKLLSVATIPALADTASTEISSPIPAPIPTLIPLPTATPTVLPLRAGEVTNRIVFVSSDSQIYTILGDGTDRVRISPDRALLPQSEQKPGYTWPGWSPDASKILYSAAVPPTLSDSPYVLMTTNSDGSSVDAPDVLYENEPGSGNVVAGGPHYSLWSPDGKRVAFIAGTRDGLTVFVADVATRTAVPVVPGAPVYMDWSYDSQELVVHLGDRLLTYVAPFDQGPSAGLEGGSIRYFAPDYAPDDGRLLFLIDTNEGAALHMSNPSNGVLERIADAGAAAWFKWSPDGGSIVLLRGSFDVNGGSAIWIVDPTSGNEEFVARGDFLMSMWSPDGQKLLLAKRNAEFSRIMEWSIYDRDDGSLTDLVEFEPSGELRMMHVFFDQYLASHSFWSPDSKSIVFAGDLVGPLNSPGDEERDIDTVWVVNTSGDPKPTAIADGFMAFWSPK